MTLCVDWLRHFGAMQHVKRAAIWPYKCTIIYSITSSALTTSVCGKVRPSAFGDGALVEFASTVDAVRCAIDIQCAMPTHNADMPPEKKIEFRIGINVGDIIVDGDDIFGDGVNVAARLESISEPGGICISDVVQQQVSGRVEAWFADLGDQNLKNIARPVRAYRIAFEEARAEHPCCRNGCLRRISIA